MKNKAFLKIKNQMTNQAISFYIFLFQYIFFKIGKKRIVVMMWALRRDYLMACNLAHL